MEIIRDTREQKGFNFFAHAEVTDETISNGDYTVRGLEDIIIVERKASCGELYNNLSKSKMKDRFHRELAELEKIKYAYIVCEFPESYLYTFPKNSGIPPSTWKYIKITAKYLRKLVHEINDNYDIDLIFCADRDTAESTTFHLLSTAWEKYGNLS